jgi:hypothetical protein
MKVFFKPDFYSEFTEDSFKFSISIYSNDHSATYFKVPPTSTVVPRTKYKVA